MRELSEMPSAASFCAKLVGRRHLEHQSLARSDRRRDVVERDEARAGDMCFVIFAAIADVQQHEIGVVLVRGEPRGRHEERLAWIGGALRAGRGGDAAEAQERAEQGSESSARNTSRERGATSSR